MTAKENARPTAATAEQALTETAAGQAVISCLHFTTVAPCRQPGFIESTEINFQE